METKAKPTTCRKESVLVESKCVIEPTSGALRWCRNEEEKVKELERWSKELMEFFRDHRSQDVNDVTVERVYETRCTACHQEWEECEYEADGDEPAYTGCGYCGLPMEIIR